MRVFSSFALFLVTFTFLTLTSCDNQPRFSIEGTIQDGAGSIVYIEKRGLVETLIVDSAKIDDNGKFSISSAAPANPEFYQLKLGSQAINLAVDSIETITIQASKNNFALDYKIEGSENSAKMKEVILALSGLNKTLTSLKKQYDGKQLSSEVYLSEINKALFDYKDSMKRLIASNPKSPVAYFALFQKLDGYLIFDPHQKDDSKLYSAVSTAWDFYYKDTPRAKHLKEFTLLSIKQRRSEEQKIALLENAVESSSADLYTIDLPNLNGKNISLSALKGKVVLLDFTIYQDQNSPAHNILLNKIYEKNKANMEIYQVSFDSDQHYWANSAANLPWICVRDKQSLSSSLIHRFNIGGLPAVYLLNKQGEIVKRISSADNLEAELKKLF